MQIIIFIIFVNFAAIFISKLHVLLYLMFFLLALFFFFFFALGRLITHVQKVHKNGITAMPINLMKIKVSYVNDLKFIKPIKKKKKFSKVYC